MSSKNIQSYLLLLLMMPFSAFALKVINQQVIFDKLNDFEACTAQYYSIDSCHDGLVRWIETHRGDSFMAGKMVRKAMRSSSAVPYFKTAFDDKDKRAICTDQDIKLAVLSALDLPLEDNQEIVLAAKKIIFETCFTQMKDSVIEATTLGSNVFKNSCNELVQLKLLNALKTKKCIENKQ